MRQQKKHAIVFLPWGHQKTKEYFPKSAHQNDKSIQGFATTVQKIQNNLERGPSAPRTFRRKIYQSQGRITGDGPNSSEVGTLVKKRDSTCLTGDGLFLGSPILGRESPSMRENRRRSQGGPSQENPRDQVSGMVLLETVVVVVPMRGEKGVLKKKREAVLAPPKGRRASIENL